MPYVCGECNEEPAIMLVQPLTGGDTVPLGADCVVPGLIGLLATFTDIDAQRIYDGLVQLSETPPEAPEPPPADPPADKPPGTRRRRPAAATAPPATDEKGNQP